MRLEGRLDVDSTHALIRELFHHLGFVMQSAHPLKILEIVSYVASYVRKRDLTACALVSKTWYQAFNPSIWYDISWEPRRQFLPKAIHRHIQLKKGNLGPEIPESCLNGPRIWVFTDPILYFGALYLDFVT
ncbi:hypothetical protein BGZ65_002934 [Modicella reniformis]|uniref:F-box domain-containing protein n=1 Tax=Modicella reniformis TaxID=1440133 RepID=A0A9P6M304_9FUNG|nr:hypothetical protein BGZ65_002934 [Modicella reniformis]